MSISTPSPADKIERHVWIISGVAMLGAVMSILDTTIVNVALDTLGRELHDKLSTIQWVVTGYMLSLAAVIPVTGWAARRFGAKQIFIMSITLFTLGSVLCGLATSSGELILFRVLQGVGGGMIMPIAQLIMADAAGPKRMGKVMSLAAIPMMLGPILGPTLGGLIIQAFGWRWIFFINLPVGLITLPLALRLLPATKGARTDRLDALGLAFMSTGLVGVTYGLAEIGSLGTVNSPRVYVPVVAGIVLVVAFVLRALRIPNPLLNLHLYRRPTFAAASFSMFALGGAVFGAMILMPLYWQTVRGYSVVDTGLLTAPQGLGMAMVMPLSNKLTERFGGGRVALCGTLAVIVFTVPFGLVGADTSVLGLGIALFLRGMGMGLTFMPTMTAAFATLRRSELSHATPQLNVLNRVGASIGTAILAVVLQRAQAGAHTLDQAAHAFGTAFWWSGALAALALIPCIVLARAERAARQGPDVDEQPAAGGPEPSALAEAMA